MILKALKVEGFRCFPGPKEIRPVNERIQILAAPNGSGKSTLFEALRICLLERHRAGGQAVEALRPWGRSLSPEITVEFSAGGETYRLFKRFLDQATAKLERLEGGYFVPLRGVKDVDQAVWEILGTNRSVKMFGGPADLGCFAALWAPQGRLALDHLPEETGAAVRASLGAHAAAPGTDLIADAVEAAWAVSFTKGGKEKKGKGDPLARAREDRDRLAAERVVALEALQALEECQEAVERLRAVGAQARREETEAERRSEALRDRAREYELLRADAEKSRAEAERAEAQWRALSDKAEALRAIARDLSGADEELRRKEGDLDAARRTVEASEAAAARAAARFEAVRARRAEADPRREEAADAERWLSARSALRRAEDRLARVREAEAALEAAVAERSGLSAPSEEEMAGIARAAEEERAALAGLSAAAVTLSIEMLCAGRLEVTEGEEPGGRDVLAGGTTTVRGSPAAAEIPGVARIRARGPGGEEEAWRERLAAARALRRDLSAGYGTEDASELAARRDRARRLDERVATARARVDAVTEDGDAAALDAERERAAAIVAEVLARRPAFVEHAPDPEALRAAMADRDGVADRDREQAERERSTADAAHLVARAALARVEAEREGARRRREDLREAEHHLREAMPTAEERAARLASLAMDRDAARIREKAAAARLAEIGGDPREEEARHRRAAEACRERARQAVEREKKEEGRLQELAGAGAFSRLARIEERIAVLDEEIAREEARRSAIGLLRDTIVAARAETLEMVRGPVEAEATRTFLRLVGSRLGGVRVRGDLVPEAVTPGMAGGPVPEARLSGGEREQLHLAVRLAIAGHLAREERQLVVLDDVLSATDAGRMARVLSVLEEASERLQIVILTCHPERYVVRPDISDISDI